MTKHRSVKVQQKTSSVMKIVKSALLCLIVGLSVPFLISHFNLKPVLGDEGILAMDGWRIYRGEVPQRDFFQFIPPLAAYVQAFYFTVFSPSVFSIRILGLTCAVLLIFLSFLLFRKLIKDQLVLALALSFLPLYIGAWLFGSHHWLCDIFQIAAMLFLLHSLRFKKSYSSVAAGILLGMAIFTLQDQGAYVVMGFFVCAFIVNNDEKRYFLFSASVGVLTFLLLSTPFALLAGSEQLFKDWVYFPIVNYGKAGGNSFSIAGYINQMTSAWNPSLIKAAPFLVISGAILSTFLFLTPILFILSIAFLWVMKSRRRSELLIISIFGLAFLLAAFHRLSLTNLSWAFIAQLPFFILLDNLLKHTNRWMRILSQSLVFSLLLTSICYTTTKLHRCLQAERVHIVQTPAGKYKFLSSSEAKSLEQLITAIDENIPKNEPMFCLGYIPLVNFISSHPNPTRLNYFSPKGYYTLAQSNYWKETLSKKLITWGVSQRIMVNEQLGSMILPEYEAVLINNDYILWKRKDD